MYLESVELTDVRTFAHLKWTLEADTPRAGWHVILGDNGSGKTTFLRAIALAIIGAYDAPAARVNARHFVASDKDSAKMSIVVSGDSDWDEVAEALIKPGGQVQSGLTMHADPIRFMASPAGRGQSLADVKSGWFSAAFGAFRRFTGSSVNNKEVYSAFPRLEPFFSIFGEDVALTDVAEWLGQLRFRELEGLVEKNGKTGRQSLLAQIKVFVNQEGFLPFGARLESVSSEEIIFLDGNDAKVPLLELSDGYRSILSMTFELVRLMAARYGDEKLFSTDGTQIVAPGVVLIDEVDAHLHPNWQRDIGPWLCRLFPNVQFIVTTHSPFVCQQAIRGSIWKLPTPGTDEKFRRVEGEELARLIYGDALDALESAAIGVAHNRSAVAQEMMEELAALDRRQTRGTLVESDRRRREKLIEKLQPVLRGRL